MSGTPADPTLLRIAKANLAEIPIILTKHVNDGATSSSVLLTEKDFPKFLDPSDCPNHKSTTIHVRNTDALSAAIDILGLGGIRETTGPEVDDADCDTAAKTCTQPDFSEDIAGGKTIVLNSCSNERPGGKYAELLDALDQGILTEDASESTEDVTAALATTTQEESLCLATTLHTTLKKEWYPWPNSGPGSIRTIYSPGVVVFRNPTTLAPLDYPKRRVVSMLSIAAPQNPPLDPTGTKLANQEDLETLRAKIRFWLRVAAMNGQERLVLGAWGCGSHLCPPSVIAEEMRKALEEKEFKGWFREIVFAIKEGNEERGKGNLEVFKGVLDGVVI